MHHPKLMSDTVTFSTPFTAPVKQSNLVPWAQRDKIGFYDESEESLQEEPHKAEVQDKDDSQENSFSAFIRPLEEFNYDSSSTVDEKPAKDEGKDKLAAFPKMGSLLFVDGGGSVAKVGVVAVKETSTAVSDLFKEITGLGGKHEAPEDPAKAKEKQEKQIEHQSVTQKGKDLAVEQKQVRQIEEIKEENRLGGDEAAYLSKTQKLDKLKLNPNLDRKLTPSDMVELRKALKGEMDEAKKQQESASLSGSKKGGFDADMNKINEGGSTMSSVGGNAG